MTSRARAHVDASEECDRATGISSPGRPRRLLLPSRRAADPRHTPEIGWGTLMPDNVVASANVYGAARKSGVKRVAFLSSMHVCGMYENDPPWSRIAAGDYAGRDPQKVPLVTAGMPARPALRKLRRPFGRATRAARMWSLRTTRGCRRQSPARGARRRARPSRWRWGPASSSVAAGAPARAKWTRRAWGASPFNTCFVEVAPATGSWSGGSAG